MGTETDKKPSRLPKPISQMGAWDFWADPYSIGLTREDADAIANGGALPDQVNRAAICGQAALNALIAAQGPQHRRTS